MNPVLEQAKWGVGGIGPRKVIGLKGIRPAGSNVGPVAHGHLDAVVSGGGVKLRPAVFRHKLSTAAVVGQKKNERVVFDLKLSQTVEHSPDALIHTINHCSIGCHLGGFPVFVLDGFPGRSVFVSGRNIPGV